MPYPHSVLPSLKTHEKIKLLAACSAALLAVALSSPVYFPGNVVCRTRYCFRPGRQTDFRLYSGCTQ